MFCYVPTCVSSYYANGHFVTDGRIQTIDVVVVQYMYDVTLQLHMKTEIRIGVCCELLRYSCLWFSVRSIGPFVGFRVGKCEVDTLKVFWRNEPSLVPFS